MLSVFVCCVCDVLSNVLADELAQNVCSPHTSLHIACTQTQTHSHTNTHKAHLILHPLTFVLARRWSPPLNRAESYDSTSKTIERGRPAKHAKHRHIHRHTPNRCRSTAMSDDRDVYLNRHATRHHFLCLAKLAHHISTSRHDMLNDYALSLLLSMVAIERAPCDSLQLQQYCWGAPVLQCLFDSALPQRTPVSSEKKLPNHPHQRV